MLARPCVRLYSRSDYRPHKMSPPPRHVLQEYQPPAGSMDHDTTYIRDFTPYQVQPMVMVQPPERRPEKTGKLDTVPTYKGNRSIQVTQLPRETALQAWLQEPSPIQVAGQRHFWLCSGAQLDPGSRSETGLVLHGALYDTVLPQ